MKILTVPQDTVMLRTESSPIQEITPEIIKFLSELGDTLKNQRDPQGVGLSAIQVGRPIRAFATFLPSILKGPTLRQGRTLSEFRFYINPEIIDHSKDLTLGEDLVQESGKREAGSGKKGLESSSPTPYSLLPKPFLEGCLSIPRIYGPVPRWEWIKAKAAILTESQLSQYSVFSIQYSVFSLDGLPSRVFQHELDHLNGVLFTDRTLEAGLQLYESREKDLVPMEM